MVWDKYIQKHYDEKYITVYLNILTITVNILKTKNQTQASIKVHIVIIKFDICDMNFSTSLSDFRPLCITKLKEHSYFLVIFQKQDFFLLIKIYF